MLIFPRVAKGNTLGSLDFSSSGHRAGVFSPQTGPPEISLHVGQSKTGEHLESASQNQQWCTVFILADKKHPAVSFWRGNFSECPHCEREPIVILTQIRANQSHSFDRSDIGPFKNSGGRNLKKANSIQVARQPLLGYEIFGAAVRCIQRFASL